jgi:hypothetical protein
MCKKICTDKTVAPVIAFAGKDKASAGTAGHTGFEHKTPKSLPCVVHKTGKAHTAVMRVLLAVYHLLYRK